jgi:uncharacterized protein YbjQ (UPF0145 family)
MTSADNQSAKQPEPFTSDLSVDEFLLVHEAGFYPLGMVAGTSIYHIGVQQSRWNDNEEMVILSDALYDARELAMSRMVKEAEQLNAHGIMGVRLTVKHLEWDGDLAEFVALGTAITDPQVDWRVKGKPFTSDLTGQDFWSLVHSGYRPLGLVMGNCVYHVAHQKAGRWIKIAGQNAEMENYTQATYEARELAMERMQLDALKLGATGIVGAQIHEGTYAWDKHMIEFFSVGTAIAPMQEKHFLPKPGLILSMND